MLSAAKKSDAIKFELEEKVQSIQQDFNAAWQEYPLESRFSQICYVTSGEGAVDSKGTQIESLLGKFESYENVAQIREDFRNLKIYCLQQCLINNVSRRFSGSYLVNLHLMEALFICAFMENLSYVIQSTTIPVLSNDIDAESKVNFKSVAKQVRSRYEEDLHKLFTNQSKAFIDKILPDIVELNYKIDVYHDKIKTIFEVKPVSADDGSLADQIQQLRSDELAYTSLLYSKDFDELKMTQQKLTESRRALLNKHNQEINKFLDKIRREKVPVQVNYDNISELAPLTTELHKAETAIFLIKRKNTLRSLETDAVLCLKEVIVGDKESDGRSLQDVVDSQKPGFFNRKNDPISIMWEKYDKIAKELDSSPQVQKIHHFTLPQPIDDAKWAEKKDSIVEKLETIKRRVIEIVNDQILGAEFLNKRDDIIKKEAEELRRQASILSSVEHSDLLEERRVALDERWSGLLACKENVEKLKEIPKELFAKSKEGDDLIYPETAARFNTKLASCRAPVLSNGIEFVDEKKAVEPEPRPLVGSVQFKREVPPDQKPKSPSWKRALFVGFVVLVLTALAATGVGLALEVSLTIMLAIVFGGVGIGLSAGVITYACTSHEDEPPTKITQVNRENAQKKSVMKIASSPSVSPVAPWFLCLRNKRTIPPPVEMPIINSDKKQPKNK